MTLKSIGQNLTLGQDHMATQVVYNDYCMSRRVSTRKTYVRGPQEHGAAAWLPAASSHVEVLEREVRAAARVITGCLVSTRVHDLLAEAGLPPVSSRRSAVAARFLDKARALPPDDPLRSRADTVVRQRLKSVTGWREVGAAAWSAAGVVSPVHTQKGIWVWTDGAADGGVTIGGAGALSVWSNEETCELQAAADAIGSSCYKAEMVALCTAVSRLREQLSPDEEDPTVACTDSQAALRRLQSGPSAQTSPLAVTIWNHLLELASDGRQLHLQWISSHCGIAGNERADELAKAASALPQDDVPVDVTTVYRTAVRSARSQTIDDCLAPGLVPGANEKTPTAAGTSRYRSEAVDVHQMRTGHWSGRAQYLHRIGRRPSIACAECSEVGCIAGRYPTSGEEADTPVNVHLIGGCLNPRPSRLLRIVEQNGKRRSLAR